MIFRRSVVPDLCTPWTSVRGRLRRSTRSRRLRRLSADPPRHKTRLTPLPALVFLGDSIGSSNSDLRSPLTCGILKLSSNCLGVREQGRVDIAAWLRSLGLEQYEQTFRDNAIGRDVLPA